VTLKRLGPELLLTGIWRSKLRGNRKDLSWNIDERSRGGREKKKKPEVEHVSNLV